MAKTGWTGDAPEAEDTLAGSFTGFISGLRPDPAEGRTLGQVLDRSRAGRDPVEEHRDQDAEQANLLARGYVPGGASNLAQRLAEAQAELASVQEANEKARKQQARIARDHQSGKITAFDIMRMDFGEPDTAAEQKLERRVQSLQGQLAEMSARIVPHQQEASDPIEAAVNRARNAGHEAFVEATRARMAGKPVPRRERPFVSRGAAAGVDCAECEAAGATADESFLIHSDPSPAPVPDNWTPDVTRAAYDAEVTRLLAAGYSLATAQAAANPFR